MQTLSDLLSVKDFIPHGYCLSWSPLLLWLNVSSDLLITLAYYSIPLTLIYFIRQRKDLPYSWMLSLFAGFIIACGTSHLLSVITIWIPLYWLEAWIKVLTALISVAAAVLMLWLSPRILSIPSTMQLKAEIEQRKLIEQALKASETKLQTNILYARNLIEANPDPMLIISQVGKIMDMNQATINVTGVNREQLIGSNFVDYFSEPEVARSCYQQVYAQGYITDFPLAIRHISGKITEVQFNASVYKNAQDEVAGVFAAARDMTQVKKIDAELRQTNADLESFSYSISHDLRAPLRAIDGFSTILREDYSAQLDAEGQRLFKVVSDNAKKMGKLIDDILFLSRTSRHEMLISLIDVQALAQEVWDSLASDRSGRLIEFRLNDLPTAYADTTALREILQNLLGNAIKFTRGREPAIIEVSGTVEGNENIYSIHDNGVGFDINYANKLFGLFQRLHSMTEFEGTGVGLAIVKRFALKHGGRVWAEGKPGEGATFWFSLPHTPF